MLRQISVAALVACCGMFAASTAGAATPTGEYAVFSQCPDETEGVVGCVYARTESGEVVLGKKTVPITKTITIQGGTTEEDAEGNVKFVAARNGETLSKTPQNVPGGLAGLVECDKIGNLLLRVLCEVTFENSVTGVTATTELAGPASDITLNDGNLLGETGVALSMPVKVHLENPFLGSECYVGSNSNPIELKLTTGATSPPPPNTSIKGSAGEETFNEEGTILTIRKNVLVDNSFAAPKASGCGGSILSIVVDPIIDEEIGLPSAAGHNTAILEGTLESVNAKAVRKHTE